MSKNATRRALLSSALSLLLCASMLVGTTFAWFTDSVTSTGNIIKSGTLDVGMYWADGTKAVPTVDTDWTDASTGAIFDYDLWEPGYTEVRHIKITNEGTLALKYQLAIRPTGTVSELADVIDVYFVDPAVQVADRTDLADANKAGTLTQILAGMPANASGKLEATKEATVTIALKMQETAGNEYQDMALASDFAVVLMATQLTAENDSFDDQYDAESKYDADVWDGLKVETPAADTEGVYRISTAAQLIGMMEDSQYPNCNKYQNVVLENNIDLAGQTVPGFGDGSGFFDGIFDGQGYTISNFTIDATDRTYYAGLFNQVSQYSGENTVIKNLTVANATISGTGQVGAIVGGMNGNTVVDNCKVIDCTLMGVKKVGAVVGYTAGGTVTNNYAKDCIVLYSEKEGGEILGYENTGSTVNNNTFDNVLVSKGSAIATAADLQAALDAATGDVTLVVAADIKGNVAVTQKAGTNLTIDGAGRTFNGVLEVFGAGRKGESESLTIKNFDFVAPAGADSCIVSPDRALHNCYSYAHNVTVENCSFTDSDGGLDCAAIRHEDGGDENWTVIGCTVDSTMHSMMQVNNVEGKLTVKDCEVYSKNGLNLNSTTNVEMTGCSFDVTGYCVRFGVNSGGNYGVAKNYVLTDNAFQSDCADGDALIIVRASARDAKLTLTGSTLTGTTEISGTTAETTVIR